MKSRVMPNSIFQNISKAYLEDEGFRKSYYAYDPFEPSDWTVRSSDLDRLQFDRSGLVQALKATNTRLGAGTKTMQSIEKLLDSRTQCVVTGQQTGIAGGPLFSLYKAATAVKQAKALSQSLGRPVVPVFWMASEDHDFEEAREVGFIDDGKLKTLRVDKKPGKGGNNPYKDCHNHSYIKEPVGWIDINTSVKHVLMEARHAFGDSEFEAWCCEVFEGTARETETLSDWFGRIYLKLFEEEGLIVADPLEPALRRLGVSFLKEAASKNESVLRSVRDAAGELEHMGFKPLIDPRQGATPLYLLERGERLQIIKNGDMFSIREDQELEGYTLDRLHEIMERHPEDFSTNVILRPVIQDVYFPTIAYVAGPGESAYYAQLKNVYTCFDMKMPIIMPRENYTVVQGAHLEGLGPYGLTIENVLLYDLARAEKAYLQSKDPLDVETLFSEFVSVFDENYASLIEKLKDIDPDIIGISKQNQGLIHQQFDYLKQKSLRFHRRNHREELRALKEIYEWIKPYGGLQERRLGLINILSIAGPDFVDFIVNGMDYDLRHRLLVIEEKGVFE